MKRLITAGALAVTIALAATGCSNGQPANTPVPTKTSQVDAAARAELPASIKTAGILRVATDATYAPNEFVDSNNVPVGWEIELINAIAAKLGLRAQIQVSNFADIIGMVQANRTDVGLSSFFDTPQRRQVVDLVDYYKAGIQWAMPKGANVSPDNACGLTIAAQKATYQSDVDLPSRSKACVDAGRKPIRILALKTQDQATEAVQLGQAAAFLADSPVTAFAVSRSSGALVTTGSIYFSSYYGMPIKQGSSLAKAVKLAMQDLMDHETYRQILNSWGVVEGAIPQALINGAK